MATAPWEITHSVETNASPAFAWHYWTNVANWDDPPAKFVLDGPFATGSRGVTRVPGEPLHWLIREVTPPNAATIEISLDGAALSFDWRFVGLADGRTLLTQRIVLKGKKADTYLSPSNPVCGEAGRINHDPVETTKLSADLAIGG
jgi:hypothetical protein